MLSVVFFWRLFLGLFVVVSTTSTYNEILSNSVHHLFPSHHNAEHNGTLLEKVEFLNGLTRTVEDELLESKIRELNDLVKETKARIQLTRLQKQLLRTEAAHKTEQEGKLLLEKVLIQKDGEIASLSNEKIQLISLKQQQLDEIASLSNEKIQLISLKQQQLDEIASLSNEKIQLVSLKQRKDDELVTCHQNTEAMALDLQMKDQENAACHTRLQEFENRPIISPPPLPVLSFLSVSEPFHSWWTVVASGLSMMLLLALLYSRSTITSLSMQLLELIQIISTATDNEQTLQAEIEAVKAETERLEAELSRTIQHGASEYQSIMETKKVFEADAELLRANIRTLEARIQEDKEETELLRSSGIASELQMTSLRSRLSAAEADAHSHKATSEKTLTSLNASLVKVKAEHTQHLKECKLAADKASKTITDAQSRLKTKNDELTSMTKTNTELTTTKVTNDKEVEALKKQLSTLQTSILQTAESTAKDIANLEATNQQMKDQMSALTMEYQSYKVASEKDFGVGTVIAQEYHSYKSTSEKTVKELNATLSKAKDEYAQHLKECKLAAEKAAKSIADLEATSKQAEGEVAAWTKKHQELTTSSAAAKSAADKRIGELDGQVKSIIEENELAENEISALKKRVAELEGKAQGLEQTIASQRVQTKADNDEIASLKKQLAELQASYAKGTADYTALTKKHEGLVASSNAAIAGKERHTHTHTHTIHPLTHTLFALLHPCIYSNTLLHPLSLLVHPFLAGKDKDITSLKAQSAKVKPFPIT